MKMRTIISITLVLGAAVSSASAAGIITFDNLTGGAPGGPGDLVTTQYSGMGVTFTDTTALGAHANNTLTSSIAGSSAPNVLWVAQGNGTTNGQYLVINFSTPVQSVSTVFGTSLSASITMAAYDGTSFLGSVNMIGGTKLNDVLSGVVSYSSAQDITSVRLFSNPVGTSISFNFSIDNLTFAVPEPSITALLGLGLAALGVRKYRRTSHF